MSASFGDVPSDRATERLRVGLAYLAQSETCISSDGVEQRHESKQQEPTQEQQDLETQAGTHASYRIRPFHTLPISGGSIGKVPKK
jgi:hypothetical protein